MTFETARTVESYQGTFSLDAADFVAAFDNQADPDEQLLYDFTRKWEEKPVSVRLGILARIAALVERKQWEASTLNLTAGAAEPK
jgi:hypothetical protein